MSSDWRLVGTYKEALSQRDDPADGGSADNAEPAQRGQKNSSFVRDIRQKRKKNEAPGKGHGRYNLAQASPSLPLLNSGQAITHVACDCMAANHAPCAAAVGTRAQRG